VTDLTTNQVVEQCQSYWLGSGVATDTAQDMATELRSHLDEATSAGKSVEAVTGHDLNAFAEAWAEASRDPRPAPTPTPPSLPVQSETKSTIGLWAGLGAIVLLVIAVALLAPHNETENQSAWVATWLIAAGVLAIGEMLTAGFFLLPFAAGAAVAGILALLSISVPVQVVTFVIVSVLSLWLLQRFAKKDIQGELLPVGAARYVGASAIVLQPVKKFQDGMVKMGTQEWRATTDGDTEITAGTEVRVIEVRGARLVIEPVN
jgi:membrane protein implicated in regulation of membrane protease activity